MELNSIIFPAPPPSYSLVDFPEELIWVPKVPGALAIPCLLLKCEEGSNKIMICFHGNAEDLKLSYDLIDLFRSVLHIHVLAVEYPGYGLYKGKSCAKALIEDAEIVYDFVRDALEFKSKDIFVFGRSIGTGPATHLARYRKLGCLMLMSAYTSIKAVVKNIGKGLSYLVKQRFNNIENIRNITCPTFLVHGKMDKLIPYTHSQMLQEACSGPCSLYIPSEMDHDKFDYCDDLVLPISAFLLQSRIVIRNNRQEINLPAGVKEPYPGQQLRIKGGKLFKLLKKFS
jgi:abhydrolase domain-containing protein 17